MKIRRSRSSAIGIVVAPARSPGRSRRSSASIAASRASSSVFSRSRLRRRSRSIARLRAVVVIQAPGLSGTPRTGHVSSAVTNASWTASSARSKSPRTRISVATARPDSSRNRRSTTSWAAAVGRRGPGRSVGGRPLRPGRRRAAGEVEDRPDLDRAVLRARDHRRVVDRLVEVGRLDEVEAAERLLGLGERAVGGDASGRRGRGPSSRSRSAASASPALYRAALADVLGERVVAVRSRPPCVVGDGGSVGSSV